MKYLNFKIQVDNIRVIHFTESRWPNEYDEIGEHDRKIDNDER